MVQEKEAENIEFKWGKKRGIGGKKKDVQFYESFTYDGVEYSLFDSVYLYSEKEPEPFIGKIIKIWENSDKTKKVKILWFFRPCEISNFLDSYVPSENELFLASGEGVGLANVNPLEAIAGKCNVVCISKDRRNPQPSTEELQKADFIFYRTFNVGRNVISDEMDDEIAKVDVKLLFNKVNSQEANAVPEFHLNKRETSRNAIVADETVVLSKDTFGECKILKTYASSIDLSAKQIADSKVRLSDQKSASGQKSGSLVGQELAVKDDPVREEIKAGKVPTITAVKVDEKMQSTKDSGDRPSKKAQIDGSTETNDENKKKNVQKVRCDPGNSDSKTVHQTATASGDKFKRRLTTDGIENIFSKKPKLGEQHARLVDSKLPKASSREASNDVSKAANQMLEVSRRPGAEKSRWFKGLPWEERITNAHEEGRLILLQNLDPSYTAAEVEDIVWHAFKQHCSAKIIHQTAFSSPHSGKAFVILKTREATENMVTKLQEGCLLLSNGRPLVGSIANLSSLGKPSIFFGHISIDRLKLQMQREMKEAVSTSHCSQPNTIEYDMAMDWCLVQEKTDLEWKQLYMQQGKELRILEATFKSK